MKKKIVSTVIACGLLTGTLAGCGGNTKPDATPAPEQTAAVESNAPVETKDVSDNDIAADFSVAMITDVGGVNDESFNQSAWEGMQRLKDDLGMKVSFIESQIDADYAPNLDKKTDEAPNIIWGIGYLMKDAIREAAEANPDQLYALIDDSFEEDELPNVISVTFKAEESSFLVGYAAALMTETDRVGLVIGMESPVMDRFRFGYEAGVQYGAKELGKEIQVDYSVVESFSDSAKGKAMAQKMYTDGCDIVFHAAGQAGTGVIEAGKEADKWAIGVDLDQNKLAPDHVLTSSLKNVGNAVYDVSVRVMNGEELGGKTIEMGIVENGVGLAESSDKNMPADQLAKVKELEEKLKAGEITAPGDKEAFDQYIAAL